MTTLESFNPATGKLVGTVPVTPSEKISAIVTRARAAQPAWRALGAEGRAAMLAKAGPLLLESAKELGRLLSQEQGKPLREAIGEVKSCGMGLEKELEEMTAALSSEDR